MNTPKTISLAIAGLIAIVISLLVIQLLLKKSKSKSETDGKLKTSYGIWFITLFVAISIVNYKMISILSEAIDNIYKMNTSNIIKETAKATSLFIGLGAVWFVVWFYIANVFAIIIVGKRTEVKEMESDNHSYFLVKGILVIGFILSLLPIFETFLKLFMPSVDMPFYH